MASSVQDAQGEESASSYVRLLDNNLPEDDDDVIYEEATVVCDEDGRSDGVLATTAAMVTA